MEEQEDREQIHEFAAVVGLIKECKKVRNVFDNAVLWFNDQFLFGDKVVEKKNVSEDALGWNPEDNQLIKEDGTTGRWGGCFTPDGFAHAIGKDDPFGLGPVFEQDAYPNRTVDNGCERTEGYRDDAERATRRSSECDAPDDHMDMVKELIDLDNRCQGCIFEYQSSFFISDPNVPNSPRDVSWVVDKFVYPISVLGNVFQEGEDNFMNEGDCTSDNGTVPVSDPRDDYPHHDRCRDDAPRNNHRCEPGRGAECERSETEATSGPRSELGNESVNETDSDPLVEPLFSVHLQVDPLTETGMGFVDRAPWEYRDGSGPVKGMPLPQDPTKDSFTKCKTDRQNSDYECAIEYNFLLAVDFEAFDDNRTPLHEDEIREGGAHHGEFVFPQPKAYEGNSHPHNPNEFQYGPEHRHNTVSLDIFFHEQAPFFAMENAYWDEHGAPPSMTADCSTTDDHTVSDERRQAVENRTPIVCDTDRDDGEFHAHDGNQTIRPVD